MQPTLIGTLLVIVLFGACRQEPKETILLDGATMGTTYHVTINDITPSQAVRLKQSIDSLLYWINKGISNYDKTSLVSYFNQSRNFDVRFPINDTTMGTLDHFFNNMEVGLRTYRASNGYFDPTVMKLVNYWGFGYTGRTKIEIPDSARIREILKSTGMEKIQYEYTPDTKSYKLKKTDSLVELDFGGIGQGYGADQMAEFLNLQGYESYLVELGGELVAKGLKKDGTYWVVGLNKPLENSSTQDVFSKVQIKDKALTTSGNYRNFYRTRQNTYSHTINPKTGFPERSTLLSVSLIGDHCTDIDAMATACMAIGIDSCKKMALSHQMEAYFIYREGDTLLTDMTTGFHTYLIKK